MGQTETRTIGTVSMTDVTVRTVIIEKTVTSMTEAAATVTVGKQDIISAGTIAAIPITIISRVKMTAAGQQEDTGEKTHTDTTTTAVTVTDGKKDTVIVEPMDQTTIIWVKMTVADLHTAVGKKTVTSTATTAVTETDGTEGIKIAGDDLFFSPPFRVAV